MNGKNRIVVDYGDTYDLVLLAVIEASTGYEVPYQSVLPAYSKLFTVVKKYDVIINNLNDLKKLEEDNKEGFVVKFEDGMRVKVKFSEYVRLHGILTNVSNLTIWEHLKNGFDFDELLDRVPDEFYDWLKKTVIGLHKDYDDIEEQAWTEYNEIHLIKGGIDRKTFAIEALKTKHSGILFRMYDKKSYDEIIWKMIRPVYSKPFKDGYETP